MTVVITIFVISVIDKKYANIEHITLIFFTSLIWKMNIY